MSTGRWLFSMRRTEGWEGGWHTLWYYPRLVGAIRIYMHACAHTHTHTHTHTHNLLDITVSDLKMRMCRVVEILSHHHHLPFIERWENAKNYGLYVWCCSSFFNERWLRGKDIKQTLLALGKIHWIKAKVWKLISKFWPKEPRRGQKWLCGHIEGRVHWIP